MRDIAKLLFGDDSVLSGLFAPGEDGDGFGMADRARRSGEWCGSTPGKGTPRERLAGALRDAHCRERGITSRF